MKTTRFVIIWLGALGVLVVVAWLAVTQTTRGWFEKDLALRAELAVSGARRALIADVRHGAVSDLKDLLADIARDERILAAALCSPDFRLLVATDAYPKTLSC
ncbi:MAG TPA: hypothetical protein VLC97_01985, partial [Rhodanobacteraceae bacterium]|nr:hypothetical protein [Rhodanobacteraceae bacterium]